MPLDRVDPAATWDFRPIEQRSPEGRGEERVGGLDDLYVCMYVGIYA